MSTFSFVYVRACLCLPVCIYVCVCVCVCVWVWVWVYGDPVGFGSTDVGRVRGVGDAGPGSGLGPLRLAGHMLPFGSAWRAGG